MRAIGEQRQRRLEEQVLTHYLAAQMNAQASCGKLTPLKDYVAMVRPPEKPDPGVMLARLVEFATRNGGAVQIERAD